MSDRHQCRCCGKFIWPTTSVKGFDNFVKFVAADKDIYFCIDCLKNRASKIDRIMKQEGSR